MSNISCAYNDATVAAKMAAWLNVFKDRLYANVNSLISDGAETLDDSSTFVYRTTDQISKIFHFTGIESESMGIDICKVINWKELTNMVDSDTVISESSLLYCKFHQVDEIYCSSKNSLIEYFVLLGNDSYDGELMRKLFQTERIVRNMWKEKDVEFHYAPIHHIDKAYVLKDYHISYKRG